MLKIKKEKKSDWLLCDFDFRSLQMCLAFADAGLNKNGIDKIGYTMYSDSIMTDRALGKDLSDIDKSKALIGDNDAHSHTGFSTFVESVNRQIIEIEDMDTHKKFVFDPEQKIKVRKGTPLGVNDKEEIILGKDFSANDVFVDYC
jgi:hypothetical protein